MVNGKTRFIRVGSDIGAGFFYVSKGESGDLTLTVAIPGEDWRRWFLTREQMIAVGNDLIRAAAEE